MSEELLSAVVENQKRYLDFGFSSITSLNVTVVSVGIVFCVILYFLFFLFVISNLKIKLTLYKLCLPCAFC
jgi:hypothetical protein